MISYYELLKMIKEGNEPDLVKLRLNCGTRYYQAFYDDGEFNYYGICNVDEENDDFKYYLADTLLESQMLEKNIDIIEEENKIEKLDIKKMSQAKKWKRDKKTWQKINEIIDVINKQD